MHKDKFVINYFIKGFPLYKLIFVHLLVNDNQLYKDARWIQRETHNSV
jgi:hypothetical protein